MGEGLPPRVQDRDHSCLGAQVFGIGGDVADGLSSRLEQDIIDDRLVLETNCRDGRRDGKDDMEIGNGQQLRSAVGEPLEPRQPLALRAVSVAAAIEGDAGHAAILATLDVTAQRLRSARLDRGHDLELLVGQPVTLGSAKSVAVAAEDVRHLQLRAHEPGSFGRNHHQREPIEWAWRIGDQMRGDLGVTGGRGKVGMSEQDLDDAQFDPALKKVSREAVPQAMGRHGLARLHRASRDPACVLQRGDADMFASLPAGKQPQAGTRAPPIGAQNIEQTG
jgi:hypothetical protein